MTETPDFLVSKTGNNTNRYLISHEGIIFSRKNADYGAKGYALKLWLLHPVIVSLPSHDLPLMCPILRKAFPFRVENLVSLSVTFLFPYKTNSMRYILFYLLFPSLECKLLEGRALPILIMILSLPGSWMALNITELINEAGHLNTGSLFLLASYNGHNYPYLKGCYEA